jgi:hypothetical protein
LKRITLILAILIGITLVPSIVKADCGASYIRNNAAHLLAIEAIPITPVYVDDATYMGTENGKRATALAGNVLTDPADFKPCPDDSDVKQRASQAVWSLWRSAIEFQDRVAYANFVANGSIQPTQPRACVPYWRALIRTYFLTIWPNNVTPAFVATFRSIPRASHVLDLWRALSPQMGIALPSMTRGYLATNIEEERYSRISDAAEAHLPSGVSCHNI